ncbi:MAG: methionyl-tRNA formyltransferase [Gemmatimonadota bacterium]
MRVLFWGTPDFAIPSLGALIGEGHDVVGVVTRPDRPAGRGRRLRASPVKKAALEEGLPVLTPEHPRGEAFLNALRLLDPQISIVVAYGHILVPEVLELPELASWNVHASLLPELRGAAPVNWAIARGYETTGITIMRMTAGMDEGPILLQREVPIAPDDTASVLYARLSELGAEALVEALGLLEAGMVKPREQDHARATYAPKLDRDGARVDWRRTAVEIARHVRGMDRIPGAWTTLDGEAIKLFRPAVVEAGREAAEGEILVADPAEGLLVRAGQGAVRIGEVQPSGKRQMKAVDWLRGGGALVGDTFL